MTPCDGTPTSETWCCGVGNTTCCNSDSAINIPAQFGKQAASATTDVPTATNTNPPSSSSSNGLSDGAKAGIGVGVARGCHWYFRHTCILDFTTAPAAEAAAGAAEQDW